MAELAPRVEVITHSDMATMRSKRGELLSAFQMDMRFLVVAVGKELPEEEVRRSVGDVVVEAMKEPSC